MVKNIKGGKGSKGFARKLMNTPVKTSVRVPENPLEVIAIVNKFYGNMCDVSTVDAKTYKCMIRKKFTGRSMHSSMISAGCIIMIGLRDYEAPNYKTCDLLEVYDQNDVRILANMPSINIQPLIAMQTSAHSSSSSASSDFNVFFSNDAPDEVVHRSVAAPIAIEDVEDVEDEINPDDI